MAYGPRKKLFDLCGSPDGSSQVRVWDRVGLGLRLGWSTASLHMEGLCYAAFL